MFFMKNIAIDALREGCKLLHTKTLTIIECQRLYFIMILI